MNSTSRCLPMKDIAVLKTNFGNESLVIMLWINSASSTAQVLDLLIAFRNLYTMQCVASLGKTTYIESTILWQHLRYLTPTIQSRSCSTVKSTHTVLCHWFFIYIILLSMTISSTKELSMFKCDNSFPFCNFIIFHLTISYQMFLRR